MQEDARDIGSIPGLGRYPGVENGNILQYSGLENSMDCNHGMVKGVPDREKGWNIKYNRNKYKR